MAPANAEQGQEEEEWEVDGRKHKRVGMEDDDEVVISSHFQNCFAFNGSYCSVVREL